MNFNIYYLGLPNIESVSVKMVNNTLYLEMTVDDQDTPPATYRAIITPGNLSLPVSSFSSMHSVYLNTSTCDLYQLVVHASTSLGESTSQEVPIFTPSE